MLIYSARTVCVLCLTGIFITIESSHLVKGSAIVHSLQDTHWNEQSALYAPASHTVDREVRSPILMELRRDLVPAHGPGGLHGVCMRVYRVLHDTHLPPAEECRRHHNSRQSILGDITEFYHTLVESGLFNRTIEFPLADRFKRFSFRASFMHLPSRGNEPAVLIETASQSGHVVCVESIDCPSTTTVILPTEKPTPAMPSYIQERSGEKKAALQLSDESTPNGDASPASGALSRSMNSATPFWDTLLSGTEPKSWFLATVALSGLCLILILVLVVTWIYVCRLRKSHARRRCRGTCRFGCRCPPEVIRQAVNSAAVHGPLDSQNAHLFGCPLTPHGNGSIRSGSGFGATMFSGGTMTSSRWGSNGCQKLGSPLYVSLANATDKATLLANCSNPTGASGPLDALNESWSLTNAQRPPSQSNRRRSAQNINCRSTSDGSSLSDHQAPGCGSKLGVGNQLRACLAVGFSESPIENCDVSTNAPPTVLINGVNASHPTDSCGSVCYQTPPVTCYGASNGTRKEVIGPLVTRSPTQLATRKTVDRCFYNPVGLSTSTGPVAEEDEEGAVNTFYSAAADKASLEVSKHGVCIPFNSRVPNSFHQTNLYPARGSESDLLNITPPSGFYDPHSVTVDSGLVNGSLTSSSFRSSTQNEIAGYAAKSIMGSSLYPIIGSPLNHQGWNRTSPVAEMVGAVELGGTPRTQTVNFVSTHPVTGHVTFMPADLSANSVSTEMHQTAPKQMLSPRLFATSERML